MRKLKIALLTCLSIIALSCNDDDNNEPGPPPEEPIMKLSPEMGKVRDYAPNNAVVAHRGTSYWAPESTEAAYRWARNMGADYLEADLQITSDGVILVLHDNNLTRTTNIKELAKETTSVFYQRANDPASSFTYEELMQLDAGSWFNKEYPSRARQSYEDQFQHITTLEDLIMFTEGKIIKRDANGKRVYTKTENTYKFEYEPDLQYNDHKPGIYLETKEPHLNPGLEQILVSELNRLGWNIMNEPATSTEQFVKGKVNVGNTNGKVVLQTFSHKSLELLRDIFKGQIPVALLLWKGSGDDDMHDTSRATYIQHINYGVKNLAQFAGPSIAGGTYPDEWEELLERWQAELIHESGMKIHPYTFDVPAQMDKYYLRCDGMFTNLADMTIKFYFEKGLRPITVTQTPEELLQQLGYYK